MISYARNLIAMTLAIVGIDAKKLGVAMKGTSAGLAQVLAGDYLSGEQNRGFTSFELSLAKLVIFIGVPMFQYLVALTVVDTWIYFTHRLCHVNKTLYRKPPLPPCTQDQTAHNLPQASSTPNTTASMSPTPTAPSTPTGSKPSS